MAIEAVVFEEEVARLLGVEQGAPAFHLIHTFWDYNDRPLSWGGFICRADRLRFTTSFGVRSSAGAGGDSQAGIAHA